MLGRQCESIYVIEVDMPQPGDMLPALKTCLPRHLDRSNLVDITTISSSWRKFLDRNTGEIHDSAEYFSLMQARGEFP